MSSACCAGALRNSNTSCSIPVTAIGITSANFISPRAIAITARRTKSDRLTRSRRGGNSTDRTRTGSAGTRRCEVAGAVRRRVASATCGTGERASWAWRIYGNTPQPLVLQRLLTLGQEATAYTARAVNTRQPASRKAWPLFTGLHVVVRHVWSVGRGPGRVAGVATAGLAIPAFIAAAQTMNLSAPEQDLPPVLLLRCFEPFGGLHERLEFQIFGQLV